MISNPLPQKGPEQLTRLQTLVAMFLEKQIGALIFVLIVSAAVFITITIVGTYMHEGVHAAINTQYGMTSEFGWELRGFMIVAYTKAIVPEGFSYSKLCNETCITLQMQNEILTYNLDAIKNLLFMIFVVFICYYHMRWFDSEAFMKHMEEWRQTNWHRKEMKRLEKELKQLQQPE